MSEHPADPILLALSPELRRRMLRIIETDGPIGPKGLAEKVGLPITNVAYHVTALEHAGLIELTHTEPARGAVAHFYERTRKNAARVDEILAAANRLR